MHRRLVVRVAVGLWFVGSASATLGCNAGTLNCPAGRLVASGNRRTALHHAAWVRVDCRCVSIFLARPHRLILSSLTKNDVSYSGNVKNILHCLRLASSKYYRRHCTGRCLLRRTQSCSVGGHYELCNAFGWQYRFTRIRATPHLTLYRIFWRPPATWCSSAV